MDLSVRHSSLNPGGSRARRLHPGRRSSRRRIVVVRRLPRPIPRGRAGAFGADHRPQPLPHRADAGDPAARRPVRARARPERARRAAHPARHRERGAREGRRRAPRRRPEGHRQGRRAAPAAGVLAERQGPGHHAVGSARAVPRLPGGPRRRIDVRRPRAPLLRARHQPGLARR
ncbi:hypothetical protein PLANTIT3_50467 [Plantibacter sp. T3]|nr:hypothetical protein PLANTIT3_50467 [Plantibacter sp. T3]